MVERIKGTIPLATSVGILAFAWTWIGLTFTFHWVTNGDLGGGLELPASFHLLVPAAFISWAMFFAAGGDNGAAGKVAISNVFGCVVALGAIVLASELGAAPDFWSIAAGVGIGGALLVVLSASGAWFFVPGTFGAFAAVFFWWTATGLDRWAAGGGGGENTVAALGDPATAGSGAFAGVLSTPYGWVALNVFVCLTIGVGLGMLSTRLAGLLTPKEKSVAPARSERLVRERVAS